MPSYHTAMKAFVSALREKGHKPFEYLWLKGSEHTTRGLSARTESDPLMLLLFCLIVGEKQNPAQCAHGRI